MAPVQFRVRPMRESDLAEWFRLRKLLWDQGDDQEHKDEMLEILGDSESQLVLVAELDDGRRVGFLESSIRPFVEDCHTDHVGYLEGWYVEPEFRRMGVGGALVRAAEKWALEHGCSEMASDAEIDNDASVRAHEKLGYKETSRLVHMRKDLA
jgi:aminoglycoside 6'-N-acetyltransferase I